MHSPTPLHEKDDTQGRFSKQSLRSLNIEFFFS